MSRLPWQLTGEQQRAALLTTHAMLASAGAGSGKTAVMAVRYCACLLDRDERGARLKPERVLALSFTRESAANLRARIDTTLRLVVRERRFSRWQDGEGMVPTDLGDEDAAHLRACLDALPAAPITTIDAFCLELAGAHAATLGRDPELAPPEELAWDRCRELAWDELRREALAGRSPGLLALVDAYGEGAARGAVSGQADRAAATPRVALRADDRDPAATLRTARATHLAALVNALAAAKHAAKAGGALAGALAGFPDQPPDEALAFSAWLRCLDELRSTDRGPDAKEAMRRLQLALEWPNRRSEPDKRPGVADRRRRASLAAMAGFDPDLEQTLAERAAAVASLAELFHGALERAAERAGLGGFARIEAEALRLLEDPAVRHRVGSQFRHVLVDEAQDLNRLQGRLIDLIQEGGRPQRSARAFVVGDHRQSIYGFRHAAPEIFGGWEISIEARGGAIAGLEENFRSHPELVEAIKRVVGQRTLAGVFRPHAIRPGRARADFGDQPPFTCWRVDPPPTASGLPPRRGSIAGSEAQATHLARIVADGIARGRAAEDHAVLVRSRARMRVYAAALERAGIAYDTDFPSGLIDSQECHDLEAIIRLALDPHDRQALAVALAGPWGGDDPQDRRTLVEALSQGPALAWAYACQRTALGEVAAAIASVLAHEGVAAAMRRLIADPRLARRYAALPLARRRLANLLRLADEERSAGRALDGAAFVARLAERRRLGVDVGEATGEAIGGRGVRLMTIHGSKGLEWPVVFIPDCDRTLEARDLRAPVVSLVDDEGLILACRPGEDDEGLGLRAGLVQDTLHRRILAEEARLFYVACTRAREELHCLASAGCTEPDEDGAVGCYGDWLAGAGVEWRAVAFDPGAVPPRAPPTAADAALLPELATALDEAVAVRGVTELLNAADLEEPSDRGLAAGAARAPARELGNRVHAALARHGPGMARALAADELAPLRGVIADARLDALVARLGDTALLPGYWRAEARLVEQPVVARVGSAIVVGVCDLLLKGPDGWRLFDWKTGEAAGHAAALAQLRVYARLVRPHLDAPLVEAALIDVERGRTTAIAPDSAAEESAWQAVVAAIARGGTD